MTEAEWNTCTDPRPMLQFLRGKVSDRKLRLFAVACCRRIWNLMTDERSKKAVEISEKYADGLLGQKKLTAARREAFAATKAAQSCTVPRFDPQNLTLVATAALHACASSKRDWIAAGTAGCASSVIFHVGGNAAGWNEMEAQSRLLCHIIGNPFRPVRLDPSCLTSTVTSTVTSLATAIYQERAFDRLPILADALEDSGCGSQEVLSHLRGGGEHTRGCWALDLVLGKE
jgi:hypothetical protein